MDESKRIEDFKLWTVPVLKDFLRKRGLSHSSKRKEELVALCFAAYVNKTALKVTAAEASKIKSHDYGSLLITKSGSRLPDPFVDLTTGWLREEHGMQKWPPTMQIDIAAYILNHVGTEHRNLGQRLMSDYKEGKAYSYFDSKWLGEVLYHGISEDSDFCVLKSKSTPSERINDIPHRIWVAIEKKSGIVQSAYCTCFAGLGSTCNHVAAVLFKIEFAWKQGLTNKACTSRACTWNQYGAHKKVIEPKRIEEMQWRKPHHGKQGSDSQKVINHTERQLFSPKRKRMDTESSLGPLVNSFFSACPKACGFQYIAHKGFQGINYSPEVDFNVEIFVEVTTTEESQTSLVDIANHGTDFNIKLSLKQISDIETETKEQSNSTEWFKQRIGRITSSTAHRVLTKVRTLKASKPDTPIDTTSLVSELMGYKTPLNNIPALKYGKSMESEARNKYTALMIKTGHKMNVVACGLHVSQDHIYIAASPDGLISCPCCGEGLLEIKCPLSAAHIHPQNANLPYLKKSGDVFYLNKNHPYYSQIQLQLGVTGRRWCDCFIYTRHGHILIRVEFDNERWGELVSACEYFFHNFIVQELRRNSTSLIVCTGTETVGIVNKDSSTK